MMKHTLTRHIGRVGALAVALGIGLATPGTAAADSTALLVGGTGIPQWNDEDSALIMERLIDPTHPGENTFVAVRTPSELWPIGSYLGPVLCPVICRGSVFDNPWPDAPLWKISGFFDLTFDQSVRIGQGDLEAEIAKHPEGNLVIYGYSQGAMVVNREKRKLADEGVERDIDFVLSGDPNLPNGGLAARFPGLYIPILDFTFNGSAPTDTSFDTISITRQYDPVSDFPLYPLNVVADVNALLGFFFVHLYPLDVDLEAPEGAIVTKTGDTTFYFFPTEELPLFTPLRLLGVPEPVIDVFEPVVREVVELGYDRSIPPGEPTPARLIPPIKPVETVTKLVGAVEESVNNAVKLVTTPPPPTPVTTLTVDEPKDDPPEVNKLSMPDTEDQSANDSAEQPKPPKVEKPRIRDLVRDSLKAEPLKRVRDSLRPSRLDKDDTKDDAETETKVETKTEDAGESSPSDASSQAGAS